MPRQHRSKESAKARRERRAQQQAETEAIEQMLTNLRPDYVGDVSVVAEVMAPAHALVQDLHQALGIPPGWQWFRKAE